MLIALVATSATAQKLNTPDNLIAYFSETENAEYITLDRTKNIGSLFPEMNSPIDSLQVLNLSKCSEKDKKKLLKTYENAFKDYLKLVKNNRENGTFMRIFVKQNGKKVLEFVLLDSTQPQIVRMFGDFDIGYLKGLQLRSLR